MKFVVVNGRTPRTRSFCTLCCESIGRATYEIYGAARLLQSQVLRRSLQSSCPRTPISCDGIMITPPTLRNLSRKWVSAPSDGTANRQAGPCLSFRYTQGALATQPWENGPPCEPALGY